MDCGRHHVQFMADEGAGVLPAPSFSLYAVPWDSARLSSKRLYEATYGVL